MTPNFVPSSTHQPMVPVTLAAVGPAMLRVAGEVADGVRLHPFCTRRYLDEVVMREVRAGFVRSGRVREQFRNRSAASSRTGRRRRGRRQDDRVGARAPCSISMYLQADDDPIMCLLLSHASSLPLLDRRPQARSSYSGRLPDRGPGCLVQPEEGCRAEPYPASFS